MSIKLIILDFDGTLIDSKKIIFDIIKREIEKAGYSLTENFKRDLGDFPLKTHLSKEGIKRDIDIIVQNIKQALLHKEKRIKPAKNLFSLRKIKQEKIILSNSPEELIAEFLKKFKVDFISEVHSPKEFHDKKKGIRNVLQKKNLKPKEAIYVGDRDRDILYARKAGCFSVALYNNISWCTKKEIINAKPDFIISDLSELKKIVDNLKKAD